MKFDNKIPVYAIAIGLLILFFAGCGIQSVNQKRGLDSYGTGDYDKAVKYLEKAMKASPNSEVKVQLFRARLNSYYSHLARARVLRDVDKKEEAVKEYKIALGIFPDNKKLINEVNDYVNPPVKESKPYVSNIKPPVTLDVDPGEKMSLNLKNTPITKIFNVVGKSYGINFIFDKDFRDFVYNVEVDKIGFYEVVNQLCMVGSAEYRVLDKSSILIYPNTTFKKRTFGLQGVKVFYLSNVKADDAKKLLMAVFRDQQILVQEDSNLNSLILKADYSTLVEIEKFLNFVDKRKSEVSIDVEIMEVSKSLMNALGVSYGDTSSPIASISAGALKADGTGVNPMINVDNLKNTNFFLTVPSAALNFLESQDKNRIIAKPNLRGVDGEEIKFMVGDEVPVPQTQFQAGAAGGFSNIPVTTYQYRNVGVEVKITPYIHKGNEVTLKVKLSINSISGYTGGFPTFGKRELENIIRLKEGETNIIGGFIKDEFRKSLRGIPALSRLPLLGKLFGSAGRDVREIDVVFSITPSIIRQLELNDTDLATIWSNVQEAPQAAYETPPEGQGPETRRDEGVNLDKPGENAVIISPPKRRMPVNSVAYFTIRVNTAAQLSSLSISGSVSGGTAAVEEAKTDFFAGQKVQVLSNVSGGSFDLGYSLPETVRTVSVVAQLKIKFTDKGNYTIGFGNLSAMTKDRQSIALTGNAAEIEVY